MGVSLDITERKRSEEQLRRTLEELQRLRDELQQQNVYLQEEVKLLHGYTRIVGQSQGLKRVLGQVEQVAPTGSTVLLLGETGTGKELIATAIHELSPRRGHAMVRVNCSAIPTSLIESELFGREKGAYTGALSKQIGRFELANGSTLFLDEIGDLPSDVQVKLLRVLEEKQIERLGSPRSVPVDVRIIAATNRDLDEAVRDGRFRQDLYYRLNVFPITVPPLRERREDIPALVSALVGEFAAALGKNVESISRESMDALQRYHWPGNVRELRNVIERAMIVAKGPKLWIEPPVKAVASLTPLLTMEEVEREHIRRVLEMTGWRVRGRNGAAEMLGIKPTTLESRMAKLGIYRRAEDRTK
jgi:formate hydrogenlyase transcriptional activator